MLIIAIEATETGQHYFESQSHRTAVWLEGYAEVPSEREAEVVGCRGYGDLTVEDGKFIDFVPRPESIPTPEEQESEPTELEQLRADVDYIAMEMGVEL